MNSIEPSSRNIANNSFGDNVTIYQGNIQNPVADQTDQCLKDLRLTDPRDDKRRIQQTKGGLLKESSNWVFQNNTFNRWRYDDKNTLLWIKGDPGKGKTMLLSAIIDELTPSTKLAKPIDRANKKFLSYFFCQGTDSRINNATVVLRGLIYLIIIQEPSLISYVLERYNHAGKDLFLDANAWVALSEILQNILRDQKVRDIVFVVDALDECETDSDKLLDLITRYTSLPHVRWLVSSRNILNIQQKLQPYVSQGILSLELKRNAETVSNAVEIYIEHRISCLHSIKHNQGQRDELRDILRQKANGTFLWVSLVVKELEDVQSWEVMEVVKEMPTDLTAVYRRMASQIRQQRRGNAKFCWKIISTIFTAYYPLSLGELGVLSGIVYFIHQSAKDFLSTEMFQSDAARRHADIYDQSTAAISTLPQNIYSVPDFGFRSEYAPIPEPNPLASMRYSCFYWADHFCDAYGTNPESGLALREKLWLFLKDHVLRWLESIALLGGLADGVRSIQKMLRELQFDTESQLSKFLRSTERFIINNGPLVTRAPLQVYGSALVFSQASSDMKKQQWRERLPLIEDIKGVIETNTAHLQTLEGHASSVTAVCFSRDGKAIASCCRETVRVWDAATGAIQQTLTALDHDILAVSFSSDDSKTIASGHTGATVNLWDVETGAHFRTFTTSRPRLPINAIAFQLDDHDHRICAIAFSPDGRIIAGGSSREVVELWDTSKGALQKKISVPSWNWDFDGGTLAVGSCEISLWDVATGQRIRQGTVLGTRCTAIAFSPNGEELASSFDELGINLQSLVTGKVERRFWEHKDEVVAITFLPEGKRFAAVYNLGPIRVWDAATGVCLQEFSFHDDFPWSAFADPSLRFRCTSIKYLADGPFLCLNHRYVINLPLGNAESSKHDLLLIDEEWITKGGKPLLWLPREYRSNAVAIQGNMVAMGHKSGITFLRLNLSALKEL
ncbi:NACHT domain-containing protein [Trichoderma breve]|uniref:NACHT domain-containing protein n=1 Tax=Trichoderma breve TaxID=2034170 RepID=A0A9W9BH68_9HYPO|nr:NACHT domain-containing protein [Trichoderma breve]KAJ4859813.1 NACHT domain-containing protein [Trichoderma breve]